MIEGEGDRSPRSSTTRQCSTIRASARPSRPRPSSRPRTRGSRPRCAPRWPSCENRGGGSSKRATRNGAPGAAAARGRGGAAGAACRAASPARLSARTDAARERIDRTEAQLARTLEELRRLAHGLHPRVLTEAGLAGALASLAEQAPVPVEVVAPAAKLPAEVEAVAYFLCSEALANIAKHASASRVSVSVTTGDGRVRSRSRTTVSAAPTLRAEQACGVSPTGSRRSEGPSTSRARRAGERASPPRSPSAARRCEPAEGQSIFVQTVCEPLERVSRVHGGTGSRWRLPSSSTVKVTVTL